MFKINDIVMIKEDESEIYYINSLKEDEYVVLKGYSHRLIRIEKLDKIDLAPLRLIEKFERYNLEYFQKISTRVKTRHKDVLFGRILHIDGDDKFLDNCLKLYEEMDIYSEGLHISEKLVEHEIEQIILQTTPDIVVITGHDTYNGQGKSDLNNYENSQHFVNAIRKIRSRFGYNELVIIAGACASHFEALIGAGANFASSPKRISTHVYDSAVAAIKVATTSCGKVVDYNNIIKYVENGKDAIGGVETFGKMRLLLR